MTGMALVLLWLSSGLGLATGMKYLIATKFFPYHAQVSGKEWVDLDSGVQTIVLGMLKIIGGGFVTLSATMLWLSYAIREGLPWAPWAILTIAAIGMGPALYVAVSLRSVRPGARTPVGLLLAGLALLIVAAGFALFA